MPLPISQVLAAQGAMPPTMSPAAMAIPHGAMPVSPSQLTMPPAGAGLGGVNMQDMQALMQAFGGLKVPPPVVPPAQDIIRPPGAVAPQGANANAVANTANTSAIASLLAAGMRPPPISALGQLIMPGGR